MYKSVVLASAHKAELIRVMQRKLAALIGFEPTWKEIMHLLEVEERK
jgi:hypothetical protein